MITLLSEHISLRLLFAQQKNSFHSNDRSNAGSSKRETGEEVFHRLREAIAQITSQEMNTITIHTAFEDLFPRNNRREKLEELKKTTGYSIQLLKPKQWIYYLSAFLFILSTIGLFISGLYGLVGIILTTGFFHTGNKTGIEFIYPTVGQAAEKITIDQLSKSDSLIS